MLLCLFCRGLACARRAVSSFKSEKQDRRIALSQRNWLPLFSVRIRLPAKLESVPAETMHLSQECLLLDHLDRVMDSDISHISRTNLIRMPGASEKDSSKEGMHIWHDNLNHG